MRGLCWSLFRRSVPLEITLVSSLTFLSSTLCSVGQKLRPFYNSDVATYVRGTFDAFRTGHVSVLVKEPSSFVSF